MPKPYTMNYGPWSPDLQNVGIQLAYQLGGQPVPCSDAYNVYWRDAAYRSLPGLSSIGPSVGTPVLSAANWYDNSTGLESIFAATANGIYSLTDGTWSAVPFVTNANAGAVGILVAVTLGTPTYTATEYSYSIAPTSQTQSGTASSYTFGAETVTASPTPGSYTWGFTSTTGPGSWSVASGAGTAVATPEVTGCTPLTTSTASFNCVFNIGGTNYTLSSALSYTLTAIYSGTVTVGSTTVGSTTVTGYYPAYSVGSISPTTDANGQTVGAVFYSAGISGSGFFLWINGTHAQSYFTTLYINGAPYASSSATYTPNTGSGYTSWEWGGSPPGGSSWATEYV